MSGIKVLSVIVFLFILLIIDNSLLYTQENYGMSQWPEFTRWYEWKKQSILTDKEKEVLNYLEIVLKIFNEAEDTRNVNPGSKYGTIDPKEALRVIDNSINELKKLPYPKECKKFKDFSIAELKEIAVYQKLRIKYKEETKDFKKMYEKYISAELKNGLGSKRFNAYFAAMRDVGLFDQILEEMITLGLLDKQQFEDFYNYFQEIDSGEMPKCSTCLGEMRRIPIIYGQIGEDKIYKEGEIIAMPGGEIDFHGKPKFAYICDKDSKLYEEYPSLNKGKVIIRNWGWGWHELVYKRQKHL